MKMSSINSRAAVPSQTAGTEISPQVLGQSNGGFVADQYNSFLGRNPDGATGSPGASTMQDFHLTMQDFHFKGTAGSPDASTTQDFHFGASTMQDFHFLPAVQLGALPAVQAGALPAVQIDILPAVQIDVLPAVQNFATDWLWG